MLVTAPGRDKPPGWDQFDREVTDAVAGQGPLRGLATALSAARTPMLVVATCDMPFVEARQFEALVDELIQRRATTWMVMTRRADSIEAAAGAGEIEPFPCAIQRAARRAIEAHLAGGARSLHSLASLAGVEVLVRSDWNPDCYTNLNRPEEYEAFLRSVSG
jgi:molybdopterin-guanine dinucleotide biosynthesis protein A